MRTEIYTSEAATAKEKENTSPIKKKEYLGVIRMRRKLLAEKKTSEAQAENTTGTVATTKKCNNLSKSRRLYTK